MIISKSGTIFFKRSSSLASPKIKLKLEFKENESYKTRYKTAFKNGWDKLKQEEKNKVTSLPWFNKEDFLKYYWVDINV